MTPRGLELRQVKKTSQRGPFTGPRAEEWEPDSAGFVLLAIIR